MIFAVLLRGERGARLENAGKMYRRGESCLLRYIGYAVIGFLQQVFSRHDSHRVDVFDDAKTGYALKQSRKIGGTEIEFGGNIGEAQFLVIVRRDVAFDIGYRFVVDIFVIFKRRILLAHESINI